MNTVVLTIIGVLMITGVLYLIYGKNPPDDDYND